MAAGETTRSAAARELQEEIGLPVNEEEIQFLATYQAKNSFMDIFVVYKDVDISSLKLKDDEVIDAKLVTGEEFQRMSQQTNIFEYCLSKLIN